MDWREHIHIDPAVMNGKPVFRDTRITVEFVLELMSDNLDVDEALKDLPRLDRTRILASYVFAAHILRKNPDAAKKLAAGKAA